MFSQSIEIKRNKFTHVTTERRIHSNISNSTTLIASEISLKRHTESRARLSLQLNDESICISQNHSSIVSTAEEHLDANLNMVSASHCLKKPKLTSSTLTLLDRIKMKQEDLCSISFNVEITSTPKKTFQRSSTHKHIGKSSKSTKPAIKSGIIHSAVVKQTKTSKSNKILRPPRFASSFQSVCKPNRKPKCTECKPSNSHAKQIKQHAKMLKVASAIPKFDTLKFPLRFLRTKTKDIDRVNFNFETNDFFYNNNNNNSHYHHHFQPISISNNTFFNLNGDYKLWIL